MSIYLISLYEPNEEAWQAIQNNWPDRHHMLTDRMAFVSPKGITLTVDIAEAMGFDLKTKRPGLVIEMTNYSGFGRGPDIEWFNKFREIVSE